MAIKLIMLFTLLKSTGNENSINKVSFIFEDQYINHHHKSLFTDKI